VGGWQEKSTFFFLGVTLFADQGYAKAVDAVWADNRGSLLRVVQSRCRPDAGLDAAHA